MRTRSVRMAFGTLAAAASLLTVTLGGCVDATGVGIGAPGNFVITVTDQNNLPVANASVNLEQRVSGRVTQAYKRPTNTTGVVELDAVGSGSLIYWVDPPSGYTGGGEAAAKPVDIIAGQTVSVTFKLTKT